MSSIHKIHKQFSCLIAKKNLEQPRKDLLLWEINCDRELLENCGVKTKKSIGWTKDHDEFACECGTLIPVDASKYHKELAKTESQSDGVQGLMEKLGK